MKRKALVALSIVGVLALVASVFPFAFGGGASAAGPERFLIFTSGDPPVNERARQALEQRGGRTLSVMHITPGLDLIDVLVPAPPGELLSQIARIPGVLEVSPDQPPELLDDPELRWGVDRVDADLVWSSGGAGQAGIGSPSPREGSVTGGLTGAGVTIAIVDSGIDLDHPDLSPNLATSGNANCIDTADDTCSTALLADDGYGHGSHVAGIAAAADNAIGVIGVAPGATLLSVKIFDNSGSSSFASVVNGIRYVAGRDSAGNVVSPRRADVMNMSFGWSKSLSKQCPSCVTTLQTIINEAWAAGVVPVAAAGNSGNKQGSGDNVGYPARLTNVLAVAATDSADKRASFSSTGSTVDIAAPGVSIYSTYKDGAYATLSGTSMASPHVAGAAALVIEAAGAGWTPGGVVSALTGTADDLGSGGFDTKYGWGLLDAQQAATGVATTP
ncbi:MAG: S8 family serine peptidase [Chloroflexi bacterium]|nr:S8 family serine peptidase [Chloroflexota bacterium]